MGLILDFVPNHTRFRPPVGFGRTRFYVHGTMTTSGRSRSLFPAPGGRRKARCTWRAGEGPVLRSVAWNAASRPTSTPHTCVAMREVAARSLPAVATASGATWRCCPLNDVVDRTWRRVLRDEWPQPHGRSSGPARRAAVPQAAVSRRGVPGFRGLLLHRSGLHVRVSCRQAAGRTRCMHRTPLRECIICLRLRSPPDSAPLASCPRIMTSLGAPLCSGHRLTAATASRSSRSPACAFSLTVNSKADGSRSPCNWRRWPDEPADTSIRALYERVLSFCRVRASPARRRLVADPERVGCRRSFLLRTLLHVSLAQRTVRWRWSSSILAQSVSQAYVAIAADLPPGAAFDFKDWLTDVSYRRTRESLLGIEDYSYAWRPAAHTCSACPRSIS